MLNHAVMEEICSAKYVHNFMDMLENMPDEIQRQITLMRELDVSYQALLNDMVNIKKELECHDNQDSTYVKRLLIQLQEKLIAQTELADGKLASAQIIMDTIEKRGLGLDQGARSLGEFQTENDRPEQVGSQGNTPDINDRPSKRLRRTPRMETSMNYSSSSSSHTAAPAGSAPSTATSTSTAAPSHSGTNNATTTNASNVTSSTTASGTTSSSAGHNSATGSSHTAAASSSASAIQSTLHETARFSPSQHDRSASQKNAPNKPVSQKKQTKKKKRKARTERDREDSPPEVPIDPDEPTYCLCEQVSYGEMIGCDNDLCPIEWFHFSCVNLTHKPKGKWFCPKCRGDKPTVMKPRAQFLRELEKYNKEKEEKS